MTIYHVINFTSGFDLLPIIQFAFLRGCGIQEIPGSLMRLLVVIEQVKGTLDVRHLLRIETGLVIIPCQTDNAVHRLAEDVVCFEQQETETADNLSLPYMWHLYVRDPTDVWLPASSILVGGHFVWLGFCPATAQWFLRAWKSHVANPLFRLSKPLTCP